MGRYISPNNSAASPAIISCPTQANVMTFIIYIFFFGLHFGQEIGHLGSDDLFLWSSLYFGQKFGQLRGCVKFAKSSPQSRKMAKNGQFCRIIPPMLNTDLHPWE